MAVSTKKMMAAFQYSKYGAPLTRVELPIPTPKKDELLIKVEAVSINPVDWKIQKGTLKYMLPVKLPYTPCADITGEVVSVGPDVKGFSRGEKVVSWLNLKTGGGLAEYALAQLKFTAKRPAEVSAVDAAALPVAAMSALQCVRDSGGAKLDGSYKGNILVTAGSGGVGSYAVQIAKLTGAHVTATCGSRNIELVKSLGADEVLDYKTREGAALKSPSGKKYDVAIQCAPSMPFSAFQPVLAPKGKVVDLSPTFGVMLTSTWKFLTMSRQRVNIFMMSANSKDLDTLLELVKRGKIKSVIDAVFPEEKVEEAWAKSSEGHASGKIVVTF